MSNRKSRKRAASTKVIDFFAVEFTTQAERDVFPGANAVIVGHAEEGERNLEAYGEMTQAERIKCLKQLKAAGGAIALKEGKS